MPKYLDRATRTLVTQYFNRDGGQSGGNTIGELAPEAQTALEKLLDACSEAEKNTARGRHPMVTVHWIRKQITEALES